MLQKLVTSADMVGEALVPYYRQILPIFNLYRNSNVNLGDKIDYAQQKGLNLGDLITQTLELFEVHGGEVTMHCSCRAKQVGCVYQYQIHDTNV